jgi:exopolyphosphatase/guanosine-5'-triphosphate,3'-diphosphate pyrophosphatase
MIGQQFTSEPKFIAGIDIGTNTILMSIAKIIDNNFEIIEDQHSIARLGEGVSKNGFINNNAIKRAKDILIKYKDTIDKYQNIKVIACGTSALRDATNRELVIDELSKIINSRIKVIPGEIEAGLSYIGAIDSPAKCLMIDIGGGSTELSVGNNFKIESRVSFNMGSVRFTENFFKQHPPTTNDIEIAEAEILNLLKNYEYPEIQEVFGVAGTITTIASIAFKVSEFKKDLIHNKVLTYEQIVQVFDILLNSSIDQIVNLHHVNPGRADVITAGVLIIMTLMKEFKIESLKVSADGLRTGIIKNQILSLFNL